jgi:hypothetical protein
MIGEPQVNAGLVELMAAGWQPLHPLIHFVLAKAHTAGLLMPARVIHLFWHPSLTHPVSLIASRQYGPNDMVHMVCKVQ